MRLRLYRRDDCVRCLSLFWSNAPTFFQGIEVDAYMTFLDDRPGPYVILEDEDEKVVACGGYALDTDAGTADLCWGLVRNDAHGRGLGRALLLARLDAIAQAVPEAVVHLNTSQHTRGFYEREGFTVVHTEADGYAPGLDRIEMARRLDEATVHAIAARWASLRAAMGIELPG